MPCPPESKRRARPRPNRCRRFGRRDSVGRGVTGGGAAAASTRVLLTAAVPRDTGPLSFPDGGQEPRGGASRHGADAGRRAQTEHVYRAERRLAAVRLAVVGVNSTIYPTLMDPAGTRPAFAY